MEIGKYTEIKPHRIKIAKSFLIIAMVLGGAAGIVNYFFGKDANLYGSLLSLMVTPIVLYVSRVEPFRYAPNVVALVIPLSFATANITLNAADPITYVWLPIVPVFLFIMSNMAYGLILSLLMLLYIVVSYTLQAGADDGSVVAMPIFSQAMVVYLFVLALMGVSEFKNLGNENSLHRELKYDYLTEIYNRRGILHELDRLIKYASRYNTLLSIIILDIDNFKKLNDEFGHDIGDDVLKYFSNLLRLNIRESDFIGRYGGEEFLILVPGLPLDASSKFAEKLRLLIQDNIHMNDINVTASFGVSHYEINDNRETLLKRADTAMYRAKRRKNWVCSQ